jgi:hypothetical protein
VKTKFGLAEIKIDPPMSRAPRVLRLTLESADHGARIERSNNDMKYMMMMHAPRIGWDKAGIGTWPQEDFKAHIGFMKRFHKELTESGELVAAEGLALPEQARIVRANKNGQPEVTDGPYPEAKEFLAGFWIVDVETTDRAYELAARASAAPGKGGVPLNMAIEVREVMSAPPVEM